MKVIPLLEEFLMSQPLLQNKSHLLWGLFLLGLGASLVSCGASNFGGKITGGADANPKASPIPKTSPGPDDFLMTWFSPCSNSKTKAPTAGKNEVVLTGAGPHKLNPKYLDEPLSMRFMGEVCNVQSMPRDIIFVVDVSGSMGPNNSGSGSDPIENGTCGRRKAIEAVVGSAGENGLAKFGVVTFSDGVVVSSKSLQGNLTSLTNDLLSASGQTDINQVLCANFGGTNYDSGLTGAETIFGSGRANSLKEIYFVSDGVPDPISASGKAIAQKLKTTGVSVGGRSTPVTIVTTMLGLADDSILRNDIASKDVNGDPLHSKVDRASRLADSLKALSQNSLEDGSIAYSGASGSAMKTISLKSFLKSSNFQSDFVPLDAKEIRGGINMVIEFKDKASNVDKKTGSIVWDEASTD